MHFSEEEKHFLRDVSASVVVPTDPNTPIDELLEIQADVDQRSHLFFDEKLKVYLILDFPACPEEELKTYLSRLELRVEAWAVDSHDIERRHPFNNEPLRDLIASEVVTQVEDPVTLVKQNEEDSKVSLHLVWDVFLTLNRPRMRIAEPSVEFVPSALLSPKGDAGGKDRYLEPFATLEANVLGPLKDMPASKDIPYLPISRLKKVIPPPLKEDIRIRLGYTASDLIKIYPAVVSRLKYTRIDRHTPFPSTIASLDIEMIPFLEIDGSIDSVQVSVPNGRVLSLTEDFLPMSCRSKDCVTLLYDLQPAEQLINDLGDSKSSAVPMGNLNIMAVSIALAVTIKLSESSSATVNMRWTTNVDFSQYLNSSFGPNNQPIQHSKRQSNVQFGSGQIRTAHQSSISSLQPLPSQIASPANGMEVLTISFTAPDAPAKVGIPFSWRVLISNRSPNPVRLAIIPLPRLQRATNSAHLYAKRHASKVSSGTVQTAERQAKGKGPANIDIARAVIDENVVYAVQHSGVIPPDIDLVSLTAELRVGPLSVGQCHESEIQFLAFKAGAFTVNTIRVVDLLKEAEEGINAAGVINDIRDLPDVIVEDDEKSNSQ